MLYGSCYRTIQSIEQIIIKSNVKEGGPSRLDNYEMILTKPMFVLKVRTSFKEGGLRMTCDF
jgi:hypothetical protein